MKSEQSITDRIGLLERRLEIRRERIARHLREARAGFERTRSRLPLVAAAGALVAGFIVARSRRRTPKAPATKRGGLVATLIAVGGTVASIARSPATKALWTAWRSSRARSARSVP